MRPIKQPALYEELTYQLIGLGQKIHTQLGPVHKEIIYQNALRIELEKTGLAFIKEVQLPVIYEGKKIGVYKPDFLVDNKVIIEIKALEFIPQNAMVQLSYYLKGTQYRIGLLFNFGSSRFEVRRRIYG